MTIQQKRNIGLLAGMVSGLAFPLFGARGWDLFIGVMVVTLGARLVLDIIWPERSPNGRP
jgi:hypothetical protein